MISMCIQYYAAACISLCVSTLAYMVLGKMCVISSAERVRENGAISGHAPARGLNVFISKSVSKICVRASYNIAYTHSTIPLLPIVFAIGAANGGSRARACEAACFVQTPIPYRYVHPDDYKSMLSSIAHRLVSHTFAVL